MDKGWIALIAVAVVALVKMFWPSKSGADGAAESMGDVASEIRRRFTAMKVKYAKEKQDDTDASSLDDWIDDSLRPRKPAKPKRVVKRKPKGGE